jgi:hypothetical protein
MSIAKLPAKVVEKIKDIVDRWDMVCINLFFLNLIIIG